MDAETVVKLRSAARKFADWLGSADGILQDVSRAADGGLPTKVLAAASIANRVLSALVAPETAVERLERAGFKLTDEGPYAHFMCQTLYASDLPREQEQLDEGGDRRDGGRSGRRVVYWCERKVAALYSNDTLDEGPFLAAEGGQAALAKAVGDVVWSSGHDLMLGVSGVDATAGIRTRGRSLQIVPMEAPGVFIGEPGLDWYVSRVQRHEGNGTRTIMLIGGTGTGKSTLGRLIARGLGLGTNRTLKVSSRVLRIMPVNDLLDAVSMLTPDVLLVDDVGSMVMQGEHREGNTLDTMLDFLESLRGRVKLAILTFMADGHYGYGEDSHYFSGLRPGRCDEILTVKQPSPRVTEKILAHYLGEGGAAAAGLTPAMFKDAVKRCSSARLAGAYLGEVARRIRAHGAATYKGEIQQVAACAPEARERQRMHRRRAKRRAKRRTAK